MALKINFSHAGALALGVAAHAVQALPGGRMLAFALASGGVLGLALQRTRFCFYCHARDWFEDRNPRGLLAIALALAVGVVGRCCAGPVGWCAAGLGAMTGLGCTIGMLLSGGMAGALSGWVFGAAVFATVGAGLRFKRVWAAGR